MKGKVVIPTYDECDNVRPIAAAVFDAAPELGILFVDDNSPDGTGDILDEMAKADDRIDVLHRENKTGLGRAYIAGFKWGLERGYDLIFEMDADFSHSPAELPNFVTAAQSADLVLGSRYVDGIRITNWPLSRLLLSKSAATYVRLITGMPITDPTGGFKCYRRDVLEAIDLDAVISNGYSFQIEMSHATWMKGFRIKEIPITFVDRRSGYSKMSTGIFNEALWMVWKLAVQPVPAQAPCGTAADGVRGVMSPTDSQAPDGPARTSRLRDFVLALRPGQWTKNGVVLAAFVFAFWDTTREQPLALADLLRVIPAVLLFCMVSSGIYVINDLRDAAADRDHPVKRRRPIASGRIPRSQAAGLGLVLLVAGLAGAFALAPRFGGVIAGYVALQIVYTFGLKRLALVDIMVIATGFVLRAIAGAVVLPDVSISPWLLLCTFLLALFLGLCKRRHEKLLLDDSGASHRPSLVKYDRHLLDQLIAIVAGATIVSYAIYTLWPETVLKFNTSALGFTVPFVVFGLFRYLDLVYRHDKGGRPEKILLTDIPTLINLMLYGITVILIFRLTAT